MADHVCIYCSAELGPGTRAAHIIPSALGGRKKSKDFCCTACNNAISPLERSLCEALRPLAARIGVRGDRGRSPSAKVLDARQGPLEVWGMQAKPVTRPPMPIAVAGNFVVLSGGAPDQAGMARQLAHVLRRAGKTPADFAKGDVKLIAGKHLGFLGGAEFSVTLGHPEHLRAVAKMVVELLAVHSPDLARRPELQRARDFVLNGAPILQVLPDAATVGLIHKSTPPAHLCEVWTSGANVIGRVVLFGLYPFTVPLTTLWMSHPFCAAYQVDPLDGRVLFDYAGRADGPLPRAWPRRTWDARAEQEYRDRFKETMQARMGQQLRLEVEGGVRQRWRQQGARKPGPGAIRENSYQRRLAL